jgi:hypothetical protein
MGPGATAFTLMPLLTSWLDRERVKATCREGQQNHDRRRSMQRGTDVHANRTAWLAGSSACAVPMSLLLPVARP